MPLAEIRKKPSDDRISRWRKPLFPDGPEVALRQTFRGQANHRQGQRLPLPCISKTFRRHPPPLIPFTLQRATLAANSRIPPFLPKELGSLHGNRKAGKPASRRFPLSLYLFSAAVRASLPAFSLSTLLSPLPGAFSLFGAFLRPDISPSRTSPPNCLGHPGFSALPEAFPLRLSFPVLGDFCLSALPVRIPPPSEVFSFRFFILPPSQSVLLRLSVSGPPVSALA